MGYYVILLVEKSKKCCVIELLWDLYRYNILLMGILVAVDIFQATMCELFLDMEKVIIYITKIVILGTGTLKEHLNTFAEVLTKLCDKRMQVNSNKSV